MGLFVDLRGSYTFANGTSTSASDGFSQTATNTDKQTFKTSGSTAIGGGLTLGYEIAQNLAVVGSFDVRSFSTREFKSATNTAPTVDYTFQQKWTNMVLGLGLRPSVKALGGEVFGGGGLAVVLPYETTATTTYSNASALFNTLTGNRTKKEEVKGYNLALGAYGEVGYKYNLTDMIGLVFSVRAVVATANNIDKTSKTTNTGNTVTTATVTYKESFSAQDNTDEAAQGDANNTRSLSNFETLGITDFSANLGVSLRF
jgi:hypothetical protein